VLLVDAAHESCCRWQDFINEDEDGLFRAELDSLSDNVDKLADGEICRYQVLLLVDSSDIRLLGLLTDDWNTVGVLLTDALSLGLS
jgi:hypothetical protein